MISIYTGTPGSGKSLHVAQRIYARDYRKKYTIGNFELRRDKLKKSNGNYYVFVDNQNLTPQKLIYFSQQYFMQTKKKVTEGEILLVIDECQILFNSRDWQLESRKAWVSFFSQHRKYGYEVILIAQFDMMVDRQIRSLIEYNYIHRKVSNFGAGGKVISLFSAGKMFVAVKMWYPLNEKVGQEFFTAKKKYYSIYDTFNTFSGFKEDQEAIKKVDLHSIFDESATCAGSGFTLEPVQEADLSNEEEGLDNGEDPTEGKSKC